MAGKTKDNLILITACGTLLSGIALSFLSFFLSVPHVIHDSVLWYFAQCLVYTGSAFGLAAYVNVKIKDIGDFIYKNQHEAKPTLHLRGNDGKRDGETAAHRQHAQ